MYPDFRTKNAHNTPSSALALENFGFAAPRHLSDPSEICRDGFRISTASSSNGRYHTILTGRIWQTDTATKTRCLRVLSDILGTYIRSAHRDSRNKHTLICGLGNRDISSDALGHTVCERILTLGGLDDGPKISVFCPGVPERSGAPADILIPAVAERIGADLLITVDALCARGIERLASVIQITDVGIVPGSALSGEHSGEISTRTMPCPVIGIGVPTVISCNTLCGKTVSADSSGDAVFVAHSAIDTIVRSYSEIIAGAINRTLISQNV